MSWINFSFVAPRIRKTFTKPVPDPKNISVIEPPVGHMACTCSTVYTGDPLIMDRPYDGHRHSSSGITLSIAPAISCTLQVIQFSNISLHLLLSSLPMTLKHTEDISVVLYLCRAAILQGRIAFVTAITELMNVLRRLFLPKGFLPRSGMSSVRFKVNCADDRMR